MTIQNVYKPSRSLGSPAAALTAAIGIFAACPAAAQTPTELQGIIVSGGLTPVQQENFGRASTVITSQQIEQRGIKQLADALRQVPGLAVSRTGGAGGNTAIRMRGSESNHVLVLIDGIETADSSGGFDFSQITADEIERIEVIRGPQSALYGSAALAGIINIITKRGIRDGANVGVTVEAGTPEAKAFSGLVRGGNSFFDVAMSISHRDDEGWDAAGEDGATDGERDGFENTTFSTKVTADVTKNLEVQGVFRWTDDEIEFDDAVSGCGTPECYVVDGDNTTEGRERIAGFTANYRMFNGALVHSPFVHYADSEALNIQPIFGDPSFSEASTFKYGYKGALYFGADREHSIAGLIEHKEETFDNTFADSEKERSQTNYAAEYKGNLTPDLFFQAGIRYDVNELFDNALTWSTSASYTVRATDTRFHGAVGKGIVNPTFFEQFGTIFGIFEGNPNLTPEESLGWDVGVEQTFFNGAAIIDVTYFNANLKNEIGTGTSASGAPTPVNDPGESDRQGIEVQAILNPIDGLFVGASYTYLDATDFDGTAETRRPQNMFGLNASYTFLDGKATVGVDVTYNANDTQFDRSSPTNVFPVFFAPKVAADDYTVVDFNASYLVTEDVKVYGILNNAFDEEYDEVLGFAARPRQGYVGVKIGY